MTAEQAAAAVDAQHQVGWEQAGLFGDQRIAAIGTDKILGADREFLARQPVKAGRGDAVGILFRGDAQVGQQQVERHVLGAQFPFDLGRGRVARRAAR